MQKMVRASRVCYPFDTMASRVAAACEQAVGAMVSRRRPNHDERGIEASDKLDTAGSKTTGGAGVKPVPPVVPCRVN
jgi:hypothetical protein